MNREDLAEPNFHPSSPKNQADVSKDVLDSPDLSNSQ